MSTHEPTTNPDPTPSPSLEPIVASPARYSVTGGTWAMVIVAAILAGAGSLVVLEAIMTSFDKSFQPTTAPYPSDEDMVNIARARIVSGNLALAVTGAFVGLLFGLAGGLSRKLVKPTIIAASAGLLLGTFVEGGVSRGLLWFIYKKLDPQADDILQSMLCHLGLWSAVGLVGGLAMGLGLGGRGRWLKTAFGGLVGAALATVAYELLGAVVLATSGANEPIGGKLEARALAQLLIPIGAAIGSLLAASDPKPKVKAVTPKSEI